LLPYALIARYRNNVAAQLFLRLNLLEVRNVIE
jgi:hypothetical protein